MFLTTEPSLVGQKYHALRVIHATWVAYSYMTPYIFFKKTSKKASDLHSFIESALGELRDAAANLGADGVIGIHHTTSVGGTQGEMVIVTVMGTAIKFY